ncbi:metal-dependent hydrolase [Halalkalicoccus sp. NIPERK01]|uniref:metal-dependent hydrolase n=1 Tax=Halalkalicoccus sp. NIPERK01 TaxID=3053469 RepID=UPI00256EA1F3|nr:metal-dependent hydrolase [Halalkalicoccus sp. NIPERK01]MDL5362557.1 metal-dependent hydrolase [Halalkalicoccus sp. NIPERK01]
MFVGHAMLAFALVAGGARLAGRSRERSLSLGVLAGAFATVPDVDMLYALSGLVGETGGVEGFWSASTLVHRAATHSLLVGAASAVGFALYARGASGERGDRFEPWTPSGLAVLLALVGVAGITSGPLGLAVMAAFALAGLAVTTAAVRCDLGPAAVGSAALVGLLSHPFGDLLTGEPPLFLYPLDVRPVAERVLLSADPTVHLLGAFGLELATIWLAAAVYCRLTGRSILAHVHWRAALGTAYAGAVLALPAPTVDSAYRFVFSVLAVGVVGPAPLARRVSRPFRAADRGWPVLDWWSARPEGMLTPLLTGLAAITLAGLSFAVGYAVL